MALARGNSNDETAIRLSVHDTIAAFNAHNAGCTVEAYNADADLVTTKGERLRGRIEIEERLGALFSKPDIALKQRLLDLTIRVVRDDMALVHVEIEMSGAISASGRPQLPHRELSLRVYVREEGTWRVTAFHNTIVATS